MRLDSGTQHQTWSGTVVLAMLAQLGISQEQTEVVEDWKADTIVATITSRNKVLTCKLDPIKLQELVLKFGSEASVQIGMKAGEVVEMTITISKVSYPSRPTTLEAAHTHSANGGGPPQEHDQSS
jgi:hypothetical protein